MAGKFRIAVVGCGQISKATAEGISKSDECEIATVLDVDQAAASELSGAYGAPVGDDFYALLEDDSIDAFYFALPHYLHAPYTIEAARAGKHVLVEKPMATNIRDAELMVEAANTHGTKLAVALPLRYGAYTQAKKLISAGAIGRILSTRILTLGHKTDVYWTNGVGGRARRSSWRAWKGTAGGGILVMNAVHFIDALLYATGLTVGDVFARGGTFASPAAVEDSIAVTMGYRENGAYGVVEASSCAVGTKGENLAWVYGTEGQIKIASSVEVYTTKSVAGLTPDEWQTIAEPDPESKPNSRALLVDDLARSVREDRKPFASGEDGLAVTKIMLRSYQSMEEGRPLPVE